MFMTGEWLLQKLETLNTRVVEATHGSARLEEFIALPFFGQIMVRFQTDPACTLQKVDELERQIQGLAGNDCLVDFMGNVYRQIGVDYGHLDEIIQKLGQRFSNEPTVPGPYARQLEDDARELLLKCGLPETTPVREIQWENGEYALLLLGTENRSIRTVKTDPVIHLLEADERLCISLMRAAFAARRMGISLGRLMLEAAES